MRSLDNWRRMKTKEGKIGFHTPLFILLTRRMLIMSQTCQITDVWLKRIKDEMKGVQFGQLQITIHNGQIVQIDRTERIRHDKPITKGSHKR